MVLDNPQVEEEEDLLAHKILVLAMSMVVVSVSAFKVFCFIRYYLKSDLVTGNHPSHQQSFIAPQPSFQPQPSFVSQPQPQYQAPQPQYQAPQPVFQAPQPVFQAPQPVFQAPQPQLQVQQSFGSAQQSFQPQPTFQPQPQLQAQQSFGSSQSFQPAPQPQQTLVQKHIYVHVPPPEQEEIRQQQILSGQVAQKHYKIIFIKAPSAPNPVAQQIALQQAQNSEKTIVYVLVKKPEDIGDIQINGQPAIQPSKPEVYFIKYKTQKGQSNIGAQGSSSFGVSQGLTSGNLIGGNLPNFAGAGSSSSGLSLVGPSQNLNIGASGSGSSVLSSSIGVGHSGGSNVVVGE